MTTRLYCSMCWDEITLNNPNHLCALCNQMTGQDAIESLDSVVGHYRELVSRPGLTERIVEFIEAETVAMVRGAAAML